MDELYLGGPIGGWLAQKQVAVRQTHGEQVEWRLTTEKWLALRQQAIGSTGILRW